MWTESSKYYDEEFKLHVQFVIKQQRPVFRSSCSKLSYMEFGKRFDDDEHVWQAFCSHVAGKHDMNRADRKKALAVENWYGANENELTDVVWKALQTAAELDFHYKYDKQYDGPTLVEEPQEDV